MPVKDTIQEDQMDIDGVPINYVKVGRGPKVILFLPGTLGTWQTDFGAQLDDFDQSRFTMVCWDPPGYGRSRPYDRIFSTQRNFQDAVIVHKLMQARPRPFQYLIRIVPMGAQAQIQLIKYTTCYRG